MEISSPDGIETINARSIVLACGGFESNPEMRARCLGPGWDLARIRGTRDNMGDGIKMAIDIGARAYEHGLVVTPSDGIYLRQNTVIMNFLIISRSIPIHGV